MVTSSLQRQARTLQDLLDSLARMEASSASHKLQASVDTLHAGVDTLQAMVLGLANRATSMDQRWSAALQELLSTVQAQGDQLTAISASRTDARPAGLQQQTASEIASLLEAVALLTEGHKRLQVSNVRRLRSGPAQA